MKKINMINSIKVGFFTIIMNGMIIPAYGSEELVFINKLIEYSSTKRDGELGSIIDNAIVELIVISPENALKLLKKNEDIKHLLLMKWQFTVFTDYKGNNREGLVKVKAKLLEILLKFNTDDNNLKKVKDELIKSLGTLLIRSID